MMTFKGDKFQDRAATAAEARKKLAERFKQAPKPDDPRVLALAEKRRDIAEARELRHQFADLVRGTERLIARIRVIV